MNNTTNSYDCTDARDGQGYDVKQVNMQYVLESLYCDQELRDSRDFNQTNQHNSIKMMDTILFEDGLKPKKWIFTDLLGRIQFKDIRSITINDVIRAFLVNLNENKKNEFSNEDLMEFLEHSDTRTKICFALSGNKRQFLNLEALCDLKNQYPQGIDALQLFKIPTRDFLPYFYFHTLSYKRTGSKSSMQTVSFTRISHFVKDLDIKSQINNAKYEENIPTEELEVFQDQMMDVSQQLIGRVQNKDHQTFVQKIKIAYLVETNNYDPWFIGTEYCQILKRKPQKSKSSLRNTQTTLKNTFISNELNFKRMNTENSQKTFNNRRKHKSIATDDDLSSLQDMTNTRFTLQDEKPENVYELNNKQLITQTDLFKGLQQIGSSYGKDSPNKIKRPKTSNLNATQKERKLVKYQEKKDEEKTKLKEKGRRFVNLFPKYVEKIGNRRQAQFIFGNQSSDRIFKEYARFRFQKDQNDQGDKVKPSTNQASKSFYNPKSTKAIFDITMSDTKDKLFQYQQLTEASATRENNFQELYGGTILANDITMFQNTSQVSLQHKNGSQLDMMIDKSMIQGAQSQLTNTNDTFIFSDQKPTYEEPALSMKTANQEELLELLKMNSGLDNIIVFDNNAQKLPFTQRNEQDQQKQEQIFSRNIKLDTDKAQAFCEWKRTQQVTCNTTQQIPKINSMIKYKRSATAIKKNTHKEKHAVTLNLLQVKGIPATQINSKNVTKVDFNHLSRTENVSLRNRTPNRHSKPLVCQCRKFCRDQELITANSIKDTDMCYIDKSSFDMVQKMVQEVGKEQIVRRYKDRYGTKNTISTYTAIQLKDIQINQERASRSKGVNMNSHMSSVNSRRKDMSIDALKSMRKSIESSEPESARKYYVKVPLLIHQDNTRNNPINVENQGISQKENIQKTQYPDSVETCGRCYSILTYLQREFC